MGGRGLITRSDHHDGNLIWIQEDTADASNPPPDAVWVDLGALESCGMSNPCKTDSVDPLRASGDGPKLDSFFRVNTLKQSSCIKSTFCKTELSGMDSIRHIRSSSEGVWRVGKGAQRSHVHYIACTRQNLTVFHSRTLGYCLMMIIFH